MQHINPKASNNTNEELARDPAARNRFSIKLFILAFAFTGAALVWICWSTYDLYAHDAILKGQAWRTEELQGTIVHLDEVLTMSATMAAFTGEPQWEARYRKFEPQLDNAFKEMLRLAPSQPLAQTEAANIKLVEMENRAFTLVRENHHEEARRILFSPEYEAQKGIYAQGMTGFFEQLQAQLEETHRSGHRRAAFSAGAGIVVLAILLITWLAIIRRMYKSHAALLVSITRRKQTEEVLRKSQRELEVRVQERTSELTLANTSLLEQIKERASAESSLRESEEKHRELFENANDVVYTHDLAGNYTSVNKACEKVTGYTAAEALRLNVAQVIAPEFHEIATEMMAAHRNAARAPTSYELEIIGKHGRRVALEVNTRVALREGKPFAVQGIARDVTERRRAEKERQAIAEVIDSVNQTSDLNSLFENVHRSLISVIDARNCFVALFDNKTGFFGMEFFVDQYDEKPPPQKLARSRIAYILRTGQPLVMTEKIFQQLVKEGEVVNVGTPPASWLGVPLATPAGVIGVLVVQHYSNPEAYDNRDLKFLSSVGGQIALALERKRAEEALHGSERKLALHIQKTPLGAIELNPQGLIVEWNPAAETIFGYRRDEVIGRSVFEVIVPPAEVEQLDQVWQDLLSKRGGWRNTNENLTKDGRTIICDWHNTSLESEGKVIGVGSLVQDITERVRMEEDLERARSAALESARLKSEFLANMSHEIRTPMNGVIGMTGLLLDTNLNEEQRDFAETIRSSGDSLLTIINDILDFSKIEAGKLQFEILDFDLGNAVEGVVELLAERASNKNLELASLIHSDVPTQLQGDPGRLRQVLTNLLGNAVKFTEQGEVIVRAEKESETENDVVVRFTVTDTGIGIDDIAKQKLFQAFTQADGSTTRKYGGTGLGLAISKQLVELMGGQIGVNSVPGKGSSFWFTGRFTKQASPAAAYREGRVSLNELHALIVDDNATNRKILSHQLSSWGMTQQESDSGMRALDLLRSAAAQGNPFDLAILDLMMPGMDGFELARRIKSDPLTAATRLVMLTSYGQRGDGSTARTLGVAAYLTKPLRQSHLFECLTDVFTRSLVEPETETAPIDPSIQLITRHVLKETATMTPKLILLAEDNIVNQKVAVRQLLKLGYRADAVANGREAVEALERIPYDLVLMDCQMPEMDGYEATAEIRHRQGQTKHTMIVAMTAHALQGDREKCIAAGMDDYISKPVKSEELAQVLERVFAVPTNTTEAASLIAEEISPPVDMVRLHEAMGEELVEILDIYLVQMSENLKRLTAAIEAGNAGEVDLIAHNCAGTSANCGMVAVLQPLRELERMGREGSLVGAAALGRQAVSEFQRLQAFLQENLAPVAV